MDSDTRWPFLKCECLCSIIRKTICILNVFPTVLASVVFFATKSTEKCGQKDCWTYESCSSKCSSESSANCQDANDIVAFCQRWHPWPPTVDTWSLRCLQLLAFRFNCLCDKMRTVCTLVLLPTGGCVMITSALNLALNDVKGERWQNHGHFTFERKHRLFILILFIEIND